MVRELSPAKAVDGVQFLDVVDIDVTLYCLARIAVPKRGAHVASVKPRVALHALIPIGGE